MQRGPVKQRKQFRFRYLNNWEAKVSLKPNKMKRKTNQSLIEVYKEMDQSQEHVCHNCGTTKNLSHSHLISRRYKDTECDPNNIVYHCMTIGGRPGCHEKWESLRERPFMCDFIANMEYEKEANYELFSLEIVKMFDFYGESDHHSENFDYIRREFKQL